MSAVETVVRSHYGRILAYLTSVFGDITTAEEGLSEAIISAVESWPNSGPPQNPEGWLVTVAKRKILDVIRRRRIQTSYAATVPHIVEDDAICSSESVIPDERLKLLFVCTHPAIDVSIRAPLMLQTVLGLDAKRIAQAFLVSPSTMSQRLVRVKSKIRDSGIPFAVPEKSQLAERLATVLDAVYVAYTSGYDALGDFSTAKNDLTGEAIFLARLVARLLPENSEVLGLLSLMLFCQARESSKVVDGVFVPLSKQEVARWNVQMIQEANVLLRKASAHNSLGRFQLEAAIQSAHIEGRRCNTSMANEILVLYSGLVSVSPSIGAYVSYAAALLETKRAKEAAAQLANISNNNLKSYQPYWVVLAEVEHSLKNTKTALAALKIALGLSENGAVKSYLEVRKQAFEADLV